MSDHKTPATSKFASTKESGSVMRLTIERVSNGFLVRNEEDLSVTVFQEPDDDYFSIVEAGHGMLWEIIDFFGLYGSKHDAKRLAVRIEKQEIDLEKKKAKPIKKLRRK